MPDPFIVSTPTTTISLPETRTAQIAVTVSNVSGHPIRARLKAVPQPPAEPAWIDIGTVPERDFAVGATENFLVTTTVPPATPPGTYLFRTDAVGEQNPDDDFAQGPTIALTVAAAERPARRFPWWIVIAAAVVVLALILFFALKGSGTKAKTTTTTTTTTVSPTTSQSTRIVFVPNVIGQDVVTATNVLQGSGLKVEVQVNMVVPSVCPPPVQQQNPLPGGQAAAGSVVLVLVNRPQFAICPSVPADAKQVGPHMQHF